MNRTLVIILSLLLASCMVGPDFQRPDAPVAKSYTAEDDVLPDEQKVRLGRQLEAEWWTLFSSEPLNGIIRQALTGNYGIAAAQETLRQTEEMIQAENGALLPQVSFGGSAGRQKYGVALFGPSDFSIPPFTYYEAGPSASWMPDIFGGQKRRIERQQALAEYQAHLLATAYVALTGNVVVQALEIASAKAEIAAAGHIIDEDEKNLKLAQAAFNAGSGTKLDILSAQSQLDTDRTLLPPLEQRLSVSRHALSILAGKVPADTAPADFEMGDFTLPAELPVSLPSELVRKRHDILAAEANLHAASAAVGIATANLYPHITLTANTLQEALTPGGLFESASNAWALAAGLTAPVFNGGTLSAEKRVAEHARQAALAQYRESVLHAFGQVADALTALKHDADAVHLQEQAVNTAAASLDLARKSYQAGNTGLLQIQDATRQLAQAQLAQIRAERQRYLDTAQLFVALGGSPVTGVERNIPQSIPGPAPDDKRSVLR